MAEGARKPPRQWTSAEDTVIRRYGRLGLSATAAARALGPDVDRRQVCDRGHKMPRPVTFPHRPRKRFDWSTGDFDAIICGHAAAGNSAADAAREIAREAGRRKITPAMVHSRARRLGVRFEPRPDRVSANLSRAMRASYRAGRSKPKRGRPPRALLLAAE